MPSKSSSSLLTSRPVGWVVLVLSTGAGLSELGVLFTNAGLPKWGHALLLGSATAGIVLQSFKASLSKDVGLAAVAEDLGVSPASLVTTIPEARPEKVILK